MQKRIIAFFLLSIQAFAEINPDLPQDINTLSGEISKVKAEIQKIDNTLVLKNKEYLATMNKRQSLDFEIYDLETALNGNIQKLEAKRTELDVLLKKALITSITENDGEELMRNRVLISRIKKEKEELALQIENENKLKTQLFTLRSQFEEKVAIERDLYEVVNKLEENKGLIVKKYLSYKEQEVGLRGKINAKKISASVAQKENLTNIVADFISPISTFLSKEHQEKGITYNVQNGEDILASKAGKVIHSGVLANYGNVMIIDHGDDIRSIYLGDMAPQVAKDQVVSANQVIAKTNVSLKKDSIGKVYFEIRNKNKVQNTIKLVKSNNRA